MGWVLILLPGQPPSPPVAMGIMRDEAACRLAGAGMALLLQHANPGPVAGFRCEQTGEAA
jgi:hypothetical protein